MSKIKTKIQCEKCKNFFSARGGNFNKHVEKCDGSYIKFVKSTNCIYCNLIFDDNTSNSFRANHTRWCDKNPKKQEYADALAKLLIANRITHATDETKLKISNGVRQAHINGKYSSESRKKALNTRTKNGNLLHSTKTKQLMSEKALASPHRRLRRKLIEYNGVMLDSTWELALAIRLDSLNINWVRPDPIKWVDGDNKIHNYFPDFYLVDHDIYLDPKNPQAIKVQQDKLKYLLTQHTNIVIIETLEQCKNFNIS
jgi:hypothetical protein